jgi:heterodisulfide reductase subunit C
MVALQETVATCMQCGTCTGSCPVAGAMDYTPRAVMRLIMANQEEAVLSSQTIWVCASCYSCAARCPRGIEITDVMTRLRHMAMQKGYRPRADVPYYRNFMDIVRRHGRMWEPELMIRYGLAVNPIKLLGQMPIALTMIRRGKLAFVPSRIAGRSEVQEIFHRIEGGEE